MGQRILVADGSETIISVCRRLLVQHGYEVTLFQDGTKALEELKRADYDLAIIATATQNVTGQFIIKELHKVRAKEKLPVLMLLGSSELVDTQELFDLAPSDTLNKPFSPQELLFRVQKLLKTAEEVSEKQEENVDIESILSDDTKSFEKKISDATDKIFLNMLSASTREDKEDEPPRLDKLDLAEDQYDLEAVNMENKAEVDTPHDYDWFIREMRGENPPPPKSAPPTGGSGTAGKFQVEEFGSSKISLDNLKKMQTATEVEKTKVYLEKLQEPFTDDSGHEAARLKDSRQFDVRQAFVKHFAEALAKEIVKNIDFDRLVTALGTEIERVGKK